MCKNNYLDKIKEFLNEQPNKSYTFGEEVYHHLTIDGDYEVGELLSISQTPADTINLTYKPLWGDTTLKSVIVDNLSHEMCWRLSAEIRAITSTDKVDIIYNTFVARSADFDDVYEHSNGVIEIPVSWGDWKHSHGHIRNLMSKLGYESIGEEVTESDGSDCYSAIHFFMPKMN